MKFIQLLEFDRKGWFSTGTKKSSEECTTVQCINVRDLSLALPSGLVIKYGRTRLGFLFVTKSLKKIEEKLAMECTWQKFTDGRYQMDKFQSQYIHHLQPSARVKNK